MNHDTQYAIRKPSGYLRWDPLSKEEKCVLEIDTYVRTPFGFVQICAWHDRSNGETAGSMQVIFDGVCYTRTFTKRHSGRYLVTLANRFAQEMHAS